MAKEFIIGVEGINYLPYYAYPESGYEGFSRDLLDLFAEQQGYQFVYRNIPINRLFLYLLNGKIDFKFPDNPQWQRDRKTGHQVYYSDAVVSYTDGVMVLDGQQGKGEGELKRLGAILGFSPWIFQDAIEKRKIELVEKQSIDALLELMKARQLDGFYVNIAVMNHLLHHTYKQPGLLVFDDSLSYTKDKYYLSSTRHPDIIVEFNQFIRDNQELIGHLKKSYLLK